MLEGNDQPVFAEDNHEVHLSIHKEHDENEIVKTHINEHIKQMRMLAGMGVPPQGQEGAGMPGEEGLTAGSGEPAGLFQMNPVVGAGAPPFTEGVDMIQQAQGPQT